MPKIDCHTYLSATPFSEDMASQARIVESMVQFDLEAVVVVSSLGIECDMINGNKQLKGVVSAERGIYGYVTVNAEFPRQSIEQQRTYLTSPDFVGTVFAPPAGRSLSLNEVFEICNGQRRYTKPIAFHTRNLEDVRSARAVAEAFPKIPIIFLGMGGDAWRSAVEAAKEFVNIQLDISGSVDADKISYAYSLIAARRLLFGSALPFSEPTIYQVLVDESKVLTTSDRRRIFRQNASMLFHINE
jgi:predicted TIM-barrel fold metal-dependent hydrolase